MNDMITYVVQFVQRSSYTDPNFEFSEFCLFLLFLSVSNSQTNLCGDKLSKINNQANVYM